MTNEHSGPNDSAADAPAPEEWIDRLAASQGRSREEILEELVSSYWTLQEMLRLVEGSEEGQALDESTAEAESPTDQLDFYDFRSDVEAELTRLEEHVTSLEAAVEDADSAGEAEALRADIERLTARVETLERAAERAEAPSADDFRTLEERFSSATDSLRNDQRTLRSRIDEEFGHLRTVLEYLLDVTDDLHRRTDSLSEGQHPEFDRLIEERQSLVDLKRDATRLGVKAADCEYCGTTVDIAMLPTPFCPQCDRRFDGVVPKSGWLPFGSNTLSIATDSSIDDDADQ